MIRLLHIDDDDDWAALVQRHLRDCADEIQVTRVSSIDEAETVEVESFSLVLLDLGLAKTSGADTIRELRVKHPTIPVVILTAVHEESVAIECAEAGADAFWVKSTDGLEPKSFYLSLRLALEKRLREIRQHDTDASFASIQEDIEFITTVLDRRFNG